MFRIVYYQWSRKLIMTVSPILLGLETGQENMELACDVPVSLRNRKD
jgi:hypothetical protein